MSFGFSVGDFVTLTQLAWTTVQNARQACGALDSLTREVTSLHIVLQRLQIEIQKPDSLLSRTEDGRLDELGTIVRGCRGVLRVLDQVLVKYNGMSDEKRALKKFKLKVQFGNGEMKDVAKIRQELATYTSALTLFLNLLGMGSLGKVEAHMEAHGGELRELKESLNWITASLQASAGHGEGSILTTYGEDDKAIWKEFRRELLREGFSSEELRMHKSLIKDYVMELGARGALDFAEEDEDVIRLDEPVPESTLQKKGKGKETARSASSQISLESDDSGLQQAEIPESNQTSYSIDLGDLDTDGSERLGEIGSPSKSPMHQPCQPKPVFMMEVRDEDFFPDAHPTCGFNNFDSNEDDKIESKLISGDEKGSVHEDDFPLSTHPSTQDNCDDWRMKPALLWIDCNRAEAYLHKAAYQAYWTALCEYIDNDLAYVPKRPQHGPYVGVRSVEIYFPYLNKEIYAVTVSDVFEQYGFDPYSGRRTRRGSSEDTIDIGVEFCHCQDQSL